MHLDVGTLLTDCAHLSLVLYCFQQVYDIFNMSCLGVIFQVRSHDGMSTPQNGAAAFLQSHVSRICQGGFTLPSLQFSSSRVSFSYGRSIRNCRGFPLTSLSLPSNRLLMQTPLHVSSLRDATRLLILSRSTLAGLWTATPFPLARRYILRLHHPP